jgi:hypothetical protein
MFGIPALGCLITFVFIEPDAEREAFDDDETPAG